MVTSLPVRPASICWLSPSEQPPVQLAVRSGRTAEASCIAPNLVAEINLNVGCPSDRVQSGCFGACLMAEPELVAIASAPWNATDVPVTVKRRTASTTRYRTRPRSLR
jgi:tRNA-dihydrouridine synthase A